MALRFVPPPGWPAAQHLPPAGWSPDPAWPPAPPGWEFYVDERDQPVVAPVGTWVPPTELAKRATGPAKRSAELDAEVATAAPVGKAPAGTKPGPIGTAKANRSGRLVVLAVLALVLVGGVIWLGNSLSVGTDHSATPEESIQPSFGTGQSPTAAQPTAGMDEQQFDRLVAKVEADGMAGLKFGTAQINTGADITGEGWPDSQACKSLKSLLNQDLVKGASAANGAESAGGVELYRSPGAAARVNPLATGCFQTKTVRSWTSGRARVDLKVTVPDPAMQGPEFRQLVVTIGNVVLSAVPYRNGEPYQGKISDPDEVFDKLADELVADYEAALG